MTATTRTPTAAEAAVARFLSAPARMIIGGEAVESIGGDSFVSINPATGRPLATVTQGDAADVDRAVVCAHAAFEHPSWRRMSPLDRGRLLNRLAELIDDNADELALLESYDNGKPVSVARAVDVGTSAKLFRYFAGWPSKYEGSTIPVSPRGGLDILNYTTHEPIGVVGAIVPWNFPMSMAVWKLAPALATGNTVVLKPAEETSLSTLRLVELIAEAGFPPGVVNVVTGPGATVGAAIAAHPHIGKVAFTGSTEVGRSVAVAATGNLKKVSLELGGKSPNIVLPDADPATVAAAAAEAIFFNQGQTCTAGSRLYVHDAVYDQVLAALVEHTERIVVGPGTNPATEMGPVVSAKQHRTVIDYIAGARTEGASVACGGERPSDLGSEYAEGYFLEPTVIEAPNDQLTVVREEIFGPVLSVLRWRDIDDLLSRANASPYGLAAGIWTNNLSHAHKIARAIQAGTVWINCYNLTDPGSPFGGYKQSGWGREMGRKALDLYTETKSVWVNLG